MAGSNPPNRLFETMTKVRTPKYTIRVWSDAGKFFLMGPEERIEEAALKSFENNHNRPDKIAEDIALLRDVTAVEILDNEGNGGLFYPDWD